MKRKIFIIWGTFALAVGLIACGNSSDSSTAATSAPTVDEDSCEAQPEEVAADSGSEESTSETPTKNTDENDTITVFEESPEKLLREEIWYSSEDGHILQSYHYEYDEAEHLSKCTNYSDSGDVKSWREYEYDDNGHRIYSSEGCKIDGSIDTWCEYEYNENEVDVITGLDFYLDYKKKLLGNKLERQSVNEFEKFLSTYFFEGKEISIIPDEKTYELKINIEDKEDRFIATIACKSAVKAKMKLAESEVDKLMERLLELPNPFTCPHGRPTAIKMSKYEIERKFARK